MKIVKLTMLFCDLDKIQTCNLLSRNQVRYSVAPRGLNKGANINAFKPIAKTTWIIYSRSISILKIV